MNWPSSLTARQYLIVLYDLIATAAAIIVTFAVRFEDYRLAAKIPGLQIFVPLFLVFSAAVFFVFKLHQSKWRFTSVPDLYNIFRVSTVLAVSLVALDYVLLSPNIYGAFFFGKVTILLYWVFQMFFLSGGRVVYRYFHYARTIQRVKKVADATPSLIVGRAADAEVLLRSIESGAVRKIWPVGILSPSSADRGQAIRGISVLGDLDDLERVVADLASRGTKVTRLVMAPSGLLPEARPESMLLRARRLDLVMSQMPSLEGGAAVQLAPVSVEDLLLRPSVKIDYLRLEEFVAGRSIVVTGGGGSIGSEICERIVAFGAARLLVIENSEPALHAVLEKLAAAPGDAKISGHIADIRDRARVMHLILGFKPDIVFHAAALKHVPILERDWGEGVKTNVLGSINVADAAAAAGAAAMVMISTDKAIEPVSVLGATKRLAEMYCEALDAEFVRRANGGNGAQGNKRAMRLISVRFGNVLASNGSVVPKFKAQIEAGGPVTVTHPDMVRYFMTIREACDLVITAASHALGQEGGKVSVYVLNMGQPVKIVDLAERIIRLSGLEPGRDIQIEFSGIRPGERLHEILFAREEEMTETGIEGIVAAKPVQASLAEIRAWVATLEQGLSGHERSVVYDVLRAAVPEFRGETA